MFVVCMLVVTVLTFVTALLFGFSDGITVDFLFVPAAVCGVEADPALFQLMNAYKIECDDVYGDKAIKQVKCSSLGLSRQPTLWVYRSAT